MAVAGGLTWKVEDESSTNLTSMPRAENQDVLQETVDARMRCVCVQKFKSLRDKKREREE